jgi:hypothetical protein
MLQTSHPTAAHHCTPDVQNHRLRLVIFQEAPSVWIVRGLEHDFITEGRTIGSALRAAIGFLQAHLAYDSRHDHAPLVAFRPAAQVFWSAYSAGTPIALSQLGIAAPSDWDVSAAVAHRVIGNVRH